MKSKSDEIKKSNLGIYDNDNSSHKMLKWMNIVTSQNKKDRSQSKGVVR